MGLAGPGPPRGICLPRSQHLHEVAAVAQLGHGPGPCLHCQQGPASPLCGPLHLTGPCASWGCSVGTQHLSVPQGQRQALLDKPKLLSAFCQDLGLGRGPHLPEVLQQLREGLKPPEAQAHQVRGLGSLSSHRVQARTCWNLFYCFCLGSRLSGCLSGGFDS